MKPFSNKVTVPLLIIAIGVSVYFLIDLVAILTGIVVLSGPIYPLYISLGISVLTVFAFASSIRARIKWERNKVNARRF